jgi:glutathione S-transferase
MMKLYYSPGACSFAIHILLCELDKPFTLVKVDLAKHQTETGQNYYQINARGSVPYLETDSGECLGEGPIIAQYLCDQAQRHDLMPTHGSMARYRVMEWQNYISTELHKSFAPLFNPTLSADTKTFFITQLKRKFSAIAEHLQAQPYLAGNTFTAADAYLFTVARWAPYVQLDLTDLSALADYLARIAKRASVQKAAETEGLKLTAAAQAV